MHKHWYSLDEVTYCFSRSSIKFLGHMGWKISDLNQVWVRSEFEVGHQSPLSNPSDLPYLFSLLCHFCEAPFLLVKHTVTWISWNWHSILLLISLWGHWIQEKAKFNTHVKPLIKAVSKFVVLTSFNNWCLIISLVPNHEWYIFTKLCFLLISIWKIIHFELV